MTNTAKSALRFALFVGVINLLADFTYEGGRSIAGPFLGSLGASATAIGVTAGLGELIGYGLRSLSGIFADRSQKYWPMAIIGYAINQFAIPLLALVTTWPLGASCIVAERTGRAIRKPAMDAMLSHAGKSIGSGWVFGLNEALDQTGATFGPLLVATIIYFGHSYRAAFAIFVIPALLCLALVLLAQRHYPHPHDLETSAAGSTAGLTSPFWIYLIAGALLGTGLADFALIGFHFQQANVIAPNIIPVYYAVAMGSGALSGLLFGHLFDRFGPTIVVISALLSAAFAPFVFLGNASAALFGMILWGIGIGIEGSLLKALVTEIVAARKRGTAFGLYDTGYGIAWFLGSAIMGVLYDRSLTALVIFSVVSQLLAVPTLFVARNRQYPKTLS